MAFSDHSLSENYSKQAIPYYEKALKINSKHYESTYDLGRCYQRLKEYKKAIDYYEKALVIKKPVSQEALRYIGDCYRSLKDYKKAIEYYQKALKQEPDNAYNVIIKADLEYCKKQLRKK
ncbi:MAG: tetratricopeptide repeat protein [Candidatus Riflebacteria bacterium]|nr:tetratricopeptide repeat protein [Candidatus Riflebacteria bacterium]